MRLSLQTCLNAGPYEIYPLCQLWIITWHRTQTQAEQLSGPEQWTDSQELGFELNVQMSHRSAQLCMNAGKRHISCDIRERKSRWPHLALVYQTRRLAKCNYTLTEQLFLFTFEGHFSPHKVHRRLKGDIRRPKWSGFASKDLVKELFFNSLGVIYLWKVTWLDTSEYLIRVQPLRSCISYQICDVVLRISYYKHF